MSCAESVQGRIAARRGGWRRCARGLLRIASRKAPWAAWLVFFFVTSARADSLEMHARVDSETVAVGDTVTYTLQALVHGSGAAASDAKPGSIAGFSLVATSQSPVRMTSWVNGQRSDVNGIVANWTLRADRAGSFVVGPASVLAGGTRQNASTVRIVVVEPGKAPRQRRGGALDPFGGSPFGSPLDPWKGLFGMDDQEPPERPAVTTDPKLALESARAPGAFLHATLDKTRAVIGEQVTLSVFLYEDESTRIGQPTDVHESTAADFVRRSLIEDETKAIAVGNALVGGRPFAVKLVRKSALFPLRAGRLLVGPMSLVLTGRSGGLRESESMVVDVSEATTKGRPTGFVQGDVGVFSLSANVAPRSLAQGAATAVTVELRGTGNLPSQVTLPVVPGVEWLEPEIHEKLGPSGGDRFGGQRTFSYVGRVRRAGTVDLGEVRLPYYDPEKHAYAVPRAALGVLQVTAQAMPDAGAEAEPPPLADLPGPRDTFEAPPTLRYADDHPATWALILGLPVLSVLVLFGQKVLGRIRARRKHVGLTPRRLALERFEEAEEAVRGADAGAVMGAIARAVEASLFAQTEVNVRGAPSDVIERELVAAGLDAERATSLLAVLRVCEDARFSPSSVDVTHAREVWQRARQHIEPTKGRP